MDANAAAKTAAPMAVFRNMESSAYVRTWAVVVAAAAVGILGLTGLSGIFVYVLQHLVVGAAILLWMQWRPQSYFLNSSVPSFLTGGLADNILLYILFWTLSYALVHVY